MINKNSKVSLVNQTNSSRLITNKPNFSSSSNICKNHKLKIRFKISAILHFNNKIFNYLKNQ